MRVRRALVPITILTGLLLLAGCSRMGAYFNTFYHAKKNYRDAERMVANSKSDRLPPEALKLYDKSIEKSAKVVQKGGGWWAGVDDAIFLMGAAYYGKRDYDEALRKFDELFLNYPKSDHIPEALYYTGLCYHRRKNYEKADEYFDRIAREYPKFKRGDDILYLVGKGFEDDGEERRAIGTYEKLIDRYPGSRHREDVLQRIGEIHFEAARYDSSLLAYSQLIDLTRDDQVFVDANLRAGQSEVRQGKYEEAVRRYESLIPENPKQLQDTPRVWIQLAEAYNLSGDHEKALEVLGKVIEEYGQTTHAVEARFQIGYTYEVYLKDFEQARIMYEEAQNLKMRSVFRDEASERLKNLQQIQELEDQAQSQEEEDEEARAEAAFKVAELLYFGTGRKDEALAKYREVEKQFQETTVGPRAAYAVAYIQYSDAIGGDAKGIEDFRDLILKYPESAQAAYALDILEEEDSANDELRALVSDAKERQRLAELAKKMRADSLMRARADSLELLEERAAAKKEQADSVAVGPMPEGAATSEEIMGPLPPASGAAAGGALEGLPYRHQSENMTDRTVRSAGWGDSLKAIRDSIMAARDSMRIREGRAAAAVDSGEALPFTAGGADSMETVADTAGVVADSAAAPADSLGTENPEDTPDSRRQP